MRFMGSRKRKTSKATLKEEKPEIAIEFPEKEDIEENDRIEELEAPEIDEDKETKGKSSGKSKIKQNIDEVKEKNGVIGYILRNATSASIDLKDPTKIIDYAVLSSSALEVSDELSNSFGLGDVKHILVEGNTVKLLSFTEKEDKVSVFMEKEVDHKTIHRNLLR